MNFELTQNEAHALAGFIALIRDRVPGPEWHKAGIEDALARARKIAPAPDLAIAAIRAAREPLNRTPAVIGMEGPHWQGSNTPPRRPFDPNTTCGVCGFSQAECRRRWSDDHEFESISRTKARRAASELDVPRAVAGLREVKATYALVEAVESAPNPHAAAVRAVLAGQSTGAVAAAESEAL